MTTGAPRAGTQWKVGSVQAFMRYPAQLAQSSRLIRAWQWSWSKGVGEGPCQLCWHRLWLLPQRRKWAACGHWATVLTGWGGGCPTVLQGPTARMPGGSGGRECRKGPSLGRSVHFPRTGAQGRGLSIRGVSGGSLPLGCPGCGFIAGLTSLPSEACSAALPVRETAFGQWIRPTDQAFQCQGWPGLDGGSGSPLP